MIKRDDAFWIFMTIAMASVGIWPVTVAIWCYLLWTKVL